MKQNVLNFLLVMSLALGFISCSKDDDENTTPSNAKVMVVHASPNAPNVDVRVNNAVALSNVPFLTNSAYTDVASGNTNIKISPTGTTTYVIDANVNLMANTNYSIFAIDSVSKIKAAVVSDNLATPAAGKAHVRFFHFSPNAPAVNIQVANNGPVLFANRSFNDQGTNANLAAFTPVDAGSYTLEVRLASNNAVALTLPALNLQAGKIYTVYAKGFAGGTGAQALGAQVIANN